MMRWVAMIVAGALLTGAAQAGDDVSERGRALAKLVTAGDKRALTQEMTPRFLSALGGADGAAKRLAGIRSQLGAETALVEERVFPTGPRTYYVRISRNEKVPSVTATYTFDASMRLDGLRIQPTSQAAATDKLNYTTKSHLRLPFGRATEAGAWRVLWGGRDEPANYHVVAHDQRFALDLVVERNGEAHRAEGLRNEDHYCWNEPLLAPADGVIVGAVGDLPDNPIPGKLGDFSGPGNHVFIDHGTGEISLLAHLRKDSLAVKKGDRVRTGQIVGRCGNSGRSFAPHLHYHLQTAPPSNKGAGLPAQFNKYLSSGRAVRRGEPHRGELINPR